MYESFFGFDAKPFSLLPDPKFLYLSKKHKIALSLLEYSLVEQAGITVLSGEIGCGKTTLISHILGKQNNDSKIGNLSNTHPSMGGLLRWVLHAFDVKTKSRDDVELYEQFVEFLENTHAAGQKAVLIVDEAQNLDIEKLEELRLLSNINSAGKQLLQLILVGQPELRTTLKLPQLVQFSQRVTMDYFIEPLSLKEISSYIKHRLVTVSGDPELFTSKALGVIAFYSQGVPRLINVLCDTALLYAFAEEIRLIDADIVKEVARDRVSGKILPIERATVVDTNITKL